MQAAANPATSRQPYRIGKTFASGLVWFRRDLRATDHAALHYALRHCTQVWCVFVFDRDILDPLLARGLQADRRVEFIRQSLLELAQALAAAGGGLIVLNDQAQTAIPALARKLEVEAVFANHDYEPAANARDEAVRQALSAQACALFTFKDQAVFERDEILNGQGKPFSVFTPYKNAWLRSVEPFDLRPYPVDPYLPALAPVPAAYRQPVPTLAQLGFGASNLAEIAMPTGASGAQALFGEFTDRMGDYGRRRDYPALRGPSYLSVHLRFGTISIRTLARTAHAAMLRGGADSAGAAVWLSELIWRDFYFMILHHHPRVAAGAAFQPAYDAIRWQHGDTGERYFRAWCDAATGYPLIDAAMLQIRQSGYMHNRLRMVTASFLVKDLGVDWRRGEQYFADQLNDFDLAANNGGWQWAASTGCDAQPWFRIFNPVTQSQKFDPQGRFIRKYLPQLAALPDKFVHAPWTAPESVLAEAGVRLGDNYPRPLVQHDVARQQTLRRYEVVKQVAKQEVKSAGTQD
ncbi:deoxyribodipyrimidine photolyase (photoreactivation), FAD-binding [Cupriavidus taiwanensis]|uniref:Deoxyribodipyrimidine photo-lyase n=1 Tax=Cupriavidus taiwanensis TaxID=164546 RepID=A0A375E0L8_9BURK|nr:deoxyribodipyrimidine photo-lyase [Cupriavidus taiwanensis]SOZ55460.1 deoxyribodipyrimidine photolyase (photoreactivation), FAD-binding [Cupriavidus taiwanensis]SOZ56936.1 deoxyribodipyrimidine photolyase (photoreactivation), FAD-binding [Cupriavidus taiwanensis]SOZ59084.1 deoxyribodipyrimidine photolyase (photoreactivation), FAD-binding [Cupriavidus taiwanensis]SPA05521.1 deoxyribodipyrimidine photolyase (photoreactivation), FAD-binding [Cupriavidus taiwanensis]